MSRNVLVLAAHPDDEVLGVGGTMAWHAARGDRVHIAIAAEGATSRHRERDAAGQAGEIEALRSAARKAAVALGSLPPRFFGFPDNRCDSVDLLDIVKAVEDTLAECKPEIVYVHHNGDVNVDHRRLHEATLAACRPLPGHGVRRLLSFETASSTEWAPPGSLPPFQPSVFVDIERHWPAKQAALRAYEAEMRPWPHARSIVAVEHLGRWRGATAGVGMAEAFMLLREVAA
jgi:LmbE family N-acetylglucosaminyl deacetylase